MGRLGRCITFWVGGLGGHQHVWWTDNRATKHPTSHYLNSLKMSNAGPCTFKLPRCCCGTWSHVTRPGHMLDLSLVIIRLVKWQRVSWVSWKVIQEWECWILVVSSGKFFFFCFFFQGTFVLSSGTVISTALWSAWRVPFVRKGFGLGVKFSCFSCLGIPLYIIYSLTFPFPAFSLSSCKLRRNWQQILGNMASSCFLMRNKTGHWD